MKLYSVQIKIEGEWQPLVLEIPHYRKAGVVPTFEKAAQAAGFIEERYIPRGVKKEDMRVVPMKQDPTEYQIDTDGTTVWVNSSKGMCVGRFGRNGVDVHADYDEQMRTGKQCLDCVHDLPPLEMWERFKTSMMTHYGVEIGDQLRPQHVV